MRLSIRRITSGEHGGLTSARSLLHLHPVGFFEVRVAVEAVFVELDESEANKGEGRQTKVSGCVGESRGEVANERVVPGKT